jgi:hypothetical protein
MKKIVGAVTLAALASGFAFAEASFNVTYRTGINALYHKLGSNTTLLDATTSNRTTSDALSFKGKTDFGGIELELDPLVTADAQSISLVKYNGWINFGDFMFKSGTWDARAVGRVNKDQGNHEGKFWGELMKPGLAAGLGTAGNGKDISQQSNKKLTNMLAYTNKDLGLEVRGAFTENTEDTSYAKAQDDGDNWEFENDLWFAEVGYKIPEFGRVLVNTKTSYKDQAFGIFVEPALSGLDQLTSLVGFTFEQDSHEYDSNGDVQKDFALALDLRARYVINDQLSVTGMFNWTGGDKKVKDGTDAKTAQFATWAMLNATYKLNDTFVPFFSAIYTSGGDAGKSAALARKEDFTASLRLYGGVEIYNTKSANLITGIVWDANGFIEGNARGTCEKAVTIPVLLRVKF